MRILHARVVHQDVEPAEGGDGSLHRPTAGTGVPDIPGHGQAAPPQLLDRGDGLGRIPVLIEVENGRVGPLPGEGHSEQKKHAEESVLGVSLASDSGTLI
jgi:hypothetical protein